MPRVSDLFGSDYLREGYLGGKPRTVVFTGFSEQSAWGETFYALHIADEPKLLKLTPTLGRDLATVFGRDEIADWVPNGEAVIYPTTVSIKDKDTGERKNVPTIRARSSPTAKPLPPSVPQRAASAPRRPDPSDDIPY